MTEHDSSDVAGLIEWDSDEWPKECICGYSAVDPDDALSHAVTEHRGRVVAAEDESSS